MAGFLQYHLQISHDVRKFEPKPISEQDSMCLQKLIAEQRAPQDAFRKRNL